ncbi:MAG: hypothetical protein HZC17_05540 [Candidatus Omnitrophica bacterium]|nr:hypothetical protein [Candidatus Omnitrophota bacterium]
MKTTGVFVFTILSLICADKALAEKCEVRLISAPDQVEAGAKQIPIQIALLNVGQETLPGATVDEYYSEKKTTAQINYGLSTLGELKNEMVLSGGQLLTLSLEPEKQSDMKFFLNIPKDATGKIILRIQPILIQQKPEVVSRPIGEELRHTLEIKGLPFYERPKMLIGILLIFEFLIVILLGTYGYKYIKA